MSKKRKQKKTGRGGRTLAWLAVAAAAVAVLWTALTGQFWHWLPIGGAIAVGLLVAKNLYPGDAMTELLVAALAAWQAVEIWRHSTLFADMRARTELWTGFWGDVLTCGWCLSVWIGFLTVAVLWTPAPVRLVEGGLGELVYAVALLWYGASNVFVYGLAVSRLANLGNDLSHRWTRTPKSNRLPKSAFENPDE